MRASKMTALDIIALNMRLSSLTAFNMMALNINISDIKAFNIKVWNMTCPRKYGLEYDSLQPFDIKYDNIKYRFPKYKSFKLPNLIIVV